MSDLNKKWNQKKLESFRLKTGDLILFHVEGSAMFF